MSLPVSVVIPSYNRAALLVRTLESILAQDVPAGEIIVVDDGSTDDTASVCAGYGDRIRYVYQANAGLPAARNTGIRAASLGWVALCDSDDLWERDKLIVQLAATTAVHADWSVTGFRLIGPNDESVEGTELGFESSFPIFKELGVSSAGHFAEWLKEEEVVVGERRVPVFAGDAFTMLFQGNVGLPSTALISRETFAAAGVFDESFRWAEDTEFFHRASASTRAAIVMLPLTRYRVGMPSMIRTGDTSPFIRFAIRSVDQASRLRPMTRRERDAYRRGRARLQVRLAYNRLAAMEPAEARAALTDGGDVRATRRGAGILVASFLPVFLLRWLHSAKRRFKPGPA